MSEKSHKKRKSGPENQNEEQKRNFRQKFSEALELPKEVVLNVSKITIIGNSNLLIENYKGVLEYEPNRIRINTNNGIITILGSNLYIKEITSEDISVDGAISGMEFLK